MNIRYNQWIDPVEINHRKCVDGRRIPFIWPHSYTVFVLSLHKRRRKGVQLEEPEQFHLCSMTIESLKAPNELIDGLKWKKKKFPNWCFSFSELFIKKWKSNLSLFIVFTTTWAGKVGERGKTFISSLNFFFKYFTTENTTCYIIIIANCFVFFA